MVVEAYAAKCGGFIASERMLWQFTSSELQEAVKSEVHVEDTQYLPLSDFSGDELYAIERLGLGTAMFHS